MSSLIVSVSAACRAFLPNPVLKFLRGDSNSVRQRFIHTPRDKFGLWWHLRRGGTYIEWYAERLDGFAAGTHVESLEALDSMDRSRLDYLESGRHDLDLLKSFGLKPTHDLHEIGVGHGRSAHHFVRYLDAGKYSGNDISRERLRIAEEHFALRGLDAKKPRLIVTRDNSFDWLDGRKVDFVWANSVFGHMPAEDVEEIISNLPKIMHENSVFFFTVGGRRPDTECKRLSVKDWLRDNEFWRELGKRQGVVVGPAGTELPTDFVPEDARLMKMKLE